MQELQPYTGMMKEAACAILVMSDTKETDSVEYSYVDCAAAIENILIEGVHLGTRNLLVCRWSKAGKN